MVLRSHPVTKELVLGQARGYVDPVKLALPQVHCRYTKEAQTFSFDDPLELVEHTGKEKVQIELAALDPLHYFAQPRHLNKAELVRQCRIFLEDPKAGMPSNRYLKHGLVFIKPDLPDVGFGQPGKRLARLRIGGNAHGQAPPAQQLH